jgi:hypothetical protein
MDVYITRSEMLLAGLVPYSGGMNKVKYVLNKGITNMKEYIYKNQVRI